MLLIVPADPLRPRRPDGHFADEAHAARDAGIEVALVDHDALAQQAEHAVKLVPTGHGEAVYRGWMLRSEQYAAFAAALGRRDVTLRTTPEQYRRAHELPGWHAALASVTPESAWTTGDHRDDFDEARAKLKDGPAVLRDYTKSLKHHWHEAAYIPDVADADGAWKVAARFRELRGDDFTGGFVVRRFEEFVSAEARTWWVGGVCRLVGAHPDTAHDVPPEDLALDDLAPLVSALGLPFVTVDLARRSDGVWRVIELGDGQVSDRPASVGVELFSTLFGDAE